ncbi:hypothetical protein Amal_00371 [Acetobacter malorum]|uniref:Uncharacterized protein n=1 Tax=Acetobacter malorum TaxID=178901 RepID=A0A177GDM6_9PROT|nr:hypothetical protein Amal_00371 [Acetobacter malorum]
MGVDIVPVKDITLFNSPAANIMPGFIPKRMITKAIINLYQEYRKRNECEIILFYFFLIAEIEFLHPKNPFFYWS